MEVRGGVYTVLKKNFRAPAKINLCLHVLGRLENGYHELAMAMQRVDLYDDIQLRVGSEAGIRVICAGVDLVSGEENIAARAARLLLQLVGMDIGVEIDITKHIPIAAGLGGGSSDAATVLLGLSEMLEVELTYDQLADIGSRLGADVPFFLFQRPAWATGIGTQLEPLPILPEVSYLLVNPRIAVSTAEVYRSLRLTKGGGLANLPRFSVVTREDLGAALHNDLEVVSLQRFPVIAEVKQELLDRGAIGALMSGSGATVFGVFPDFRTANSVGNLIAEKKDWMVCPVRPI